MVNFPEDLKYGTDHEWVRPGNGSTVRIGVSEYATEQLGDIVYVSLPEVGEPVTAGEPCGELESTKSVSDVMAPVSGVVAARNDAAVESTEMINADPYGDGWLFEVDMSDADEMDALLDADAYAEHVGA